jgi:hypothetical protein
VAAICALWFALTLWTLFHNFHNGGDGEDAFTTTFWAGALAVLSGMLAWATARPIRASRVVRLAVASIVGVVLIFCGLWLALRPNDMGSYEPNCFPPLVEGLDDTRCSSPGRVGGGLALTAGGIAAIVVARFAARREMTT